MRKSLLRCFVPLLLFAGAPTSEAAAQEPLPPVVVDSIYEISLLDGSSHVGRVVATTAASITIETANGTRIQIPRAQIRRISFPDGTIRGTTFWRADPNRTRLFFSPTARSIPAGEGYFGVYELFIPFIGYALSDRLIIAGGSPLYLALTGDVDPPFYIGPKLQVLEAGPLDGAVGALGVFSGEGESFGIFYGVATYGSADHAVTGGLGWGYVQDEFTSRPVLMIGGETRVSRMLKLVTENLILPEEPGLISSAGVRFFGERLSADAGLAAALGEGYCCLPVVNFVYHFGGR